MSGRVLGIDVGARRIGLAISDVTRTLARPLTTVHAIDATDGLTQVAHQIEALAADEDGLDEIVVGMPARLDGSPTNATPRAEAFVDGLRKRTAIPIVTEDERLTSREAESRLALDERNWRKRKMKLDAAAAAIILQDYLDRSRA